LIEKGHHKGRLTIFEGLFAYLAIF